MCTFYWVSGEGGYNAWLLPCGEEGQDWAHSSPRGVSHLPDFLQFDPFVEYTQTQYHPYNTFGKMSKSMSPFPRGLHPSL